MKENKRKEINRHINTAFAHISKIPVSDVYVDYMSTARKELAAASAILNDKSEEVKEQDNG